MYPQQHLSRYKANGDLMPGWVALPLLPKCFQTPQFHIGTCFLNVTRNKTMEFLILSQSAHVSWEHVHAGRGRRDSDCFALVLTAAVWLSDVSVLSDKPFPSKLLLLTKVGFAAGRRAISFSPVQWQGLSPSTAAITLPMSQQLFLWMFIFGNYH